MDDPKNLNTDCKHDQYYDISLTEHLKCTHIIRFNFLLLVKQVATKIAASININLISYRSEGPKSKMGPLGKKQGRQQVCVSWRF